MFEGRVHKISIDAADYVRLGCPKLVLRHRKQYTHVLIKANSAVYLSRKLVRCPLNMRVDHLNHDPLDNRMANLRLVTPQENSFHTRSHKDSAYSQFKGVSYDKNSSPLGKKWQAKICSGPITRKKRFLTETEAALWWNEQALELHGEFAVLNEL